MLLSEFATTDVINAMFRGIQPSFTHEIWDNIEAGPVWWETGQHGVVTLASVFGVMCDMAHHAFQLSQGLIDSVDIERFERALNPSYPTIEDFPPESCDSYADPSARKAAVYSQALCQAFQHAASIFLYRAICRLSTEESRFEVTVSPYY